MIRKATEEDIPRIVELAKMLASESSFNTLTFAPDRVEKTAQIMISNGFAYVYEKDGVVVGGMLGDAIMPWYSTDLIGMDCSLFIEKEHRNGFVSGKLVNLFEKWCWQTGCKQIRPGIGTGINSMSRLYEKLGYEPQGKWFLKNRVE